jgi:hypothetical protein
MRNTLAGHLPLQDMISSTIENAKQQMEASRSEKTASAKTATQPAKAKTASSSVIDPSDPDDIEKLASALDEIGDDFINEKEAAIENGGESHQGGMQLQTTTPVSGHQSYKKDGSKKHAVPMSTGMQASSDGNGATQVPNDAKKAPGGPAMPAKGVMKTAAESSVFAKIQAKKDEAKGEKKEDKGEKSESKEEKKEDKEKKSSAVDFLLGKFAESSQGGLTQDTKSGEGTKPAGDAKGGNDARKALESNSAATNMKKVDGKGPQKRMLSEVLTEPALAKSTDSKVQENLRNASKGGVKIAAAKNFLQKIASDPNDPRHEKLKEAFAKQKEAGKKEKKSMGSGMSPMPTGNTPPSMPGM